MAAIIVPLRRGCLFAATLLLTLWGPVAGHAQLANDDQPDFPTTDFADGARSASVTSGGITAGISMVRRADKDPDHDIPLLQVIAGGQRVFEVPGVASGLDEPAADASIAKIDPDSSTQDVYFASYSGGAHCCANAVVAEQLGGKWIAVQVGNFDGDGNFLEDLNGDGTAEIVTVDNRFLYQFDCYACSAAPLQILTIKGGKVVDASAESRFLPANREWLKQIEDGVDPKDRWTSPGYLAGWVAQKIRVGEGADAWKQLNQRWNLAKDSGEEVCLTGGEPESCVKKNLATLKFPERLKLFLEQNGYSS